MLHPCRPCRRAQAGDHVSYEPGLFTADTGGSHVVVQPSEQTGVPRPPVPVGFGGAHAAVGGGTKAPCSSFAPIELRWDGLSVSFTNSKGCTTAVLTGRRGAGVYNTIVVTFHKRPDVASNGCRWALAG